MWMFLWGRKDIKYFSGEARQWQQHHASTKIMEKKNSTIFTITSGGATCTILIKIQKLYNQNIYAATYYS